MYRISKWLTVVPFIALLFCTRAWSAEPSFYSYHELLVPMLDQRLKDALDLDETQAMLLDETLVKYDVELPTLSSFDDLEKDPQDLLTGMAKKLLQADKASKGFFEEGLLPEQSDKLLCVYFYRVGINAFAHPAVAERISLTVKQSEKIRVATKTWREARLKAWSNLEITKQEMDRQGRSLQLFVDLRSTVSIPLAFSALSKTQTVELKKILNALKEGGFTLSLGFPPL